MKQARGAGGLPGADDDNFSVVPVESTSESIEHLEFLKTSIPQITRIQPFLMG